MTLGAGVEGVGWAALGASGEEGRVEDMWRGMRWAALGAGGEEGRVEDMWRGVGWAALAVVVITLPVSGVTRLGSMGLNIPDV